MTQAPPVTARALRELQRRLGFDDVELETLAAYLGFEVMPRPPEPQQ